MRLDRQRAHDLEPPLVAVWQASGKLVAYERAVGLRVAFVRDIIRSGVASARWVPSRLNAANGLTKRLGALELARACVQMGVFPLPPELRESDTDSSAASDAVPFSLGLATEPAHGSEVFGHPSSTIAPHAPPAHPAPASGGARALAVALRALQSRPSGGVAPPRA